MSSKSEEICCICLGEVIEKALLDMCLHFFCFACIKRWSEKKTTCPLCTVPFRTIMYNIKSDYEYLEHRVAGDDQKMTHLELDRRRDLVNEIRLHINVTSQNDRTVSQRSQMQERRSHRPNNMAERAADLLTRSRWASGAKENPSNYVICRSEIYKMNLWAKDLRAIEGIPVRVRDVTPTFLSRNEACCHRLYRWLNREVPAILGHSRIFKTSEVIGKVIDNCKRFFILSENFNDKIYEIFGAKTKHFVHEFYRFACSPYDMEDYDKNVIYGPPIENSLDVTLSSESDVEDVVILRPSSSQDSSVLLLEDDILNTKNPRSSQNRDSPGSIESLPQVIPISSNAKKLFLQKNLTLEPSRHFENKAHKKRKIVESDIEEDEDSYGEDDDSEHIKQNKKRIFEFKVPQRREIVINDLEEEDDLEIVGQNKQNQSKIQLNCGDKLLSGSQARVDVDHVSFKKHHSGHKNRPEWRM